MFNFRSFFKKIEDFTDILERLKTAPNMTLLVPTNEVVDNSTNLSASSINFHIIDTLVLESDFLHTNERHV